MKPQITAVKTITKLPTKRICIAFTEYAAYDSRILQNSVKAINGIDWYHINIDMAIIMSIQIIAVFTKCRSGIV